MDTDSGITTPEGRKLTAKTLIGNGIKNGQDENLGDVQDLMIDPRGGKIAYVVVCHGGVLGVCDKLFAVPRGAFSLDTDGHNFILEVDKTCSKTPRASTRISPTRRTRRGSKMSTIITTCG